MLKEQEGYNISSRRQAIQNVKSPQPGGCGQLGRVVSESPAKLFDSMTLTVSNSVDRLFFGYTEVIQKRGSRKLAGLVLGSRLA